MILDPTKEKELEFTLNLDGAKLEEVQSYLDIELRGFHLLIPTSMNENGKVLVSIPPLTDMMNYIPENNQVRIKIRSIINENYFEPYESTMEIKKPTTIVATFEEEEKKSVAIVIDEKKKVEDKKKEGLKTKLRAILEK